MNTQPRRFHLERDVDTTGVSGEGHVADGIRWRDGTASVIWLGARPSVVFWYRIGDGMTDAEWVHTHGGGTDTRIVWDDPEPTTDEYPLASGCAHCPDGHMPPDHGQPWGAYVGSERDGDGQPITIHVARVAGAHVAEADAQWVRDRLNAPSA
ncbi:hypothetical protein [Streptomyces antimycoticus]|uniref:hypothetical protein n=1 Tax=Streptomyces antimycoticus TaxID=68175 RepID=UPI0036E77CCF